MGLAMGWKVWAGLAGRWHEHGRPRVGLEAAGGSRGRERRKPWARPAPGQKPACADTPRLRSTRIRTGGEHVLTPPIPITEPPAQPFSRPTPTPLTWG